MKKLLNLLAVTSLVVPTGALVVSCGPLLNKRPNPEDLFDDLTDQDIAKQRQVKNQKWEEVLRTDYSSWSPYTKTLYSESKNYSSLASKDIFKPANSLGFTPYADMGIVEDAAELLMKDKGVGGANRADAESWLRDNKSNNPVYNDPGEYAIDYFNNPGQENNGIKLGFMQNASDTGELVPMWNAAPSIDVMNPNSTNGILDEQGQETEYARWFNDRYRKWIGQETTEHWQKPSEGKLNPKDVTISFGPFANSLWHTAWENNKTPEELAEVLLAISNKYGTKKFDFYFASPYLTAKGGYADSQKLLASALKILLESDNEFDFTLSLVVSHNKGISIQEGWQNLDQIGDEAFPLYNFTQYLGMNFRLNLVPYLTPSSEASGGTAGIETDWEEKVIEQAIEHTHKNWVDMHNKINPNNKKTDSNTTRHMSVTPWIGRRAEKASYSFTTQDAYNLRKFAEKYGMGQISMFYISRDIPSEFKPNYSIEEATVDNYADKNELDQNIRSGAGYKEHSYSDLLSGRVSSLTEELKTEAKSKEEVKKKGGIDYWDDINANDTLKPNGEWTNPGWETPTPGGGVVQMVEMVQM